MSPRYNKETDKPAKNQIEIAKLNDPIVMSVFQASMEVVELNQLQCWETKMLIWIHAQHFQQVGICQNS